jgi:hypothetical protein
VSFGFWWGAGIPVWRFDLGYDDVDISLRLDITKDGFNTFEHPFQLKQLPAEGDGVWLNLDDIALQPLATSTADSLP